MRPHDRRCLAAALAAAFAGLALAAPVRADESSERERLAEEKRAVERRFAAEEVACRERFTVSACLEEVRRAKRKALADVDARQIALDDAERQRRAQARQARIERKQARRAAEGERPNLELRERGASKPLFGRHRARPGPEGPAESDGGTEPAASAP